MKAIILAAGNGVRMRPLTNATPKPLLMVGGQTLLDHLVGQFPQEIDELIIVVRYLGEKIQAHCGTLFYGRAVTYVHQPNNVNGTFAAVKICEPSIARGERFFVFYADDLIGRAAITECLKYSCAIVVAEVTNPEQFGVVMVNADGSLASIVEKPAHPETNLVSTNTLLLTTDIFNHESPAHSNGEQYLPDALCAFAKIKPVAVVKTNTWLPIGYPDDLAKAEAFIKK